MFAKAKLLLKNAHNQGIESTTQSIASLCKYVLYLHLVPHDYDRARGFFVVMGKPDVAFRQCPLAIDKWLEMVIGPKQTMLGLIIDTNRLH